MKVKKKDKKEEDTVTTITSRKNWKDGGICLVSLYREEREHGTELSELAPCQSLVVLQLHLHL